VNRTAWLVIGVTGRAFIIRSQDQMQLNYKKQKLPTVIFMTTGNFYNISRFLQYSAVLIVRCFDVCLIEEEGLKTIKLNETQWKFQNSI
jgi:hypothetical protein